MNSRPRNVALFVAAFSLVILPITLVVFSHDLSAQDDLRESEVCADCHEDEHDYLSGTPHQILIEDVEKPDAVACTDCHAGDARHYDDDPEEYPMTNPARLGAWNQAQVCGQCHLNSHQQNMVERNAHVMNEVNCSSCHQIHGVHEADETYGAGEARATHLTGLLKKNEVDLCLDCHTNVRGEFARPTHHPVMEGIVRCSQCHLTYDRTRSPLSFIGTNEACFTCHNEFQMPFPYEHQATVDFSVEEGACLNCHEPHGSNLPRMLKQPYEGPNYQLCSQCHSVPKHNFNSFHGSQWAGVPCNDCHVDIHGSYTSQYFFTPEMQSRGCINVGCHAFSR